MGYHLCMQVIEVDFSEIIFYDRNPRRNDHVVAKIASGIREYGFKIPILLKKDMTVIDGHLRLKAAKKLKLTKIPAIFVDDLTETQIKAFRISVNKSSELAEWDPDLLTLELEELKSDGFDLTKTHFNTEEIETLFSNLIKDVSPGTADEQSFLGTDSNLSTTQKTKVCPNCGYEVNCGK